MKEVDAGERVDWVGGVVANAFVPVVARGHLMSEVCLALRCVAPSVAAL